MREHQLEIAADTMRGLEAQLPQLGSGLLWELASPTIANRLLVEKSLDY
jgi:hypothetical protein